ncbi:MAG: hypothetical protein ACQESK_03245 [Bacteroidota bacterium]
MKSSSFVIIFFILISYVYSSSNTENYNCTDEFEGIISESDEMTSSDESNQSMISFTGNFPNAGSFDIRLSGDINNLPCCGEVISYDDVIKSDSYEYESWVRIPVFATNGDTSIDYIYYGPSDDIARQEKFLLAILNTPF